MLRKKIIIGPDNFTFTFQTKQRTITLVFTVTEFDKIYQHYIKSFCSILVVDVRLRVKVEYVDHQEVLGNSVHSHKRHEIERQFEKFSQASTILKSRDLGTVVCDIKFSELTSLDAFWRDYTNGALLEALKVVFITGMAFEP